MGATVPRFTAAQTLYRRAGATRGIGAARATPYRQPRQPAAPAARVHPIHDPVPALPLAVIGADLQYTAFMVGLPLFLSLLLHCPAVRLGCH